MKNERFSEPLADSVTCSECFGEFLLLPEARELEGSETNPPLVMSGAGTPL